MKLFPQVCVFEQPFAYIKGYLHLQAGYSQKNGLFGHRMFLAAPEPMQSRISIELTLEFSKFEPLEDVAVFLEKVLNLMEQRISLPMLLHGKNADIYLTAVVPIRLSVDVHMQDGKALVFICPIMQTLVEGVNREVLLEHVVWVNVFFVDGVGFAPEEEGVLAREGVPCEVPGYEGGEGFAEVDGCLFDVVLAPSAL